MLFNSLAFAVYLPLVFAFYWLLKPFHIRWQNCFILTSSYIFYGWWDWRFLSLILISTVVDYTAGIQIHKTPSVFTKKVLLWVSISVNLGLLGIFKYFHFFQDNLIALLSHFNINSNPSSLAIILPIGISFYTFQTLSYTIDVYRGKSKPTRDFIAFSAFVSFFPQLVAGPIERASNLLPQFMTKRTFDYSKAVEGLRQILWGLFKKIVIADNCAKYANLFFNNSEVYSGSTLALGAFFFSFQIYGDFSGYSDIAIGTARLFGFKLMDNFSYPYFSRDIAEFWRRWHISLSTWFRDYLYIPLGGSRVRALLKVRNIFLIFIVSGLWHGANWTFILWGAMHAALFIPLILFNKNRRYLAAPATGRTLPSGRDLVSIALTFTTVTLAWVFFRAEAPAHAYLIFSKIFSSSVFYIPQFPGRTGAAIIILILCLFMMVEWFGREKPFAISNFAFKQTAIIRWGFYYFLISLIFLMGGSNQDFIYFQF